jgi:2'-5' RNA ligase
MVETIGILSILEGAVAEESKRLWTLFENVYGSKGVQSFDYPNVTFQAGYCHDIALVQNTLAALSRNLSPFTVIVDGLDYFDSSSKAVFLSVQLTAELRQINQTINDMLSKCCEEIFESYRPEKWRPHITVAMDDLTDENFARAWQDLKDYQPHYRQTLSNICLVYVNKTTQHIEVVHREVLSSPE